MRWGLGVRTPEFSVWVLVLGVLIVTVIGQQQHIGGKQQQQQQQSHLQHPGNSQQQSSSSLASSNQNKVEINRQSQQQQQQQQQAHSSQKSKSGNGYKQLDEKVKVLEASLLKMFGMKRRPRPRRKIHIPQYILDLYHRHNQDSDDISFNFKVKGTATHSANTIRSFYHKDDGSFAENQVDHNHVRFEYDINNIPDDETITAAELRIYRHPPTNLTSTQSNDEERTTTEALEELARQKHRIDIYEIIKPSTRTREAITRLIDTRVVLPERHSQWESFDVHPAVLKWRQSPHLNFGLEVHVSNLHDHSSKLQHVRLKRSTRMTESQWMAEQPLLVTYSDDGKAPSKGLRRTRKKRSNKHKKRSRSHHYSRRKKQQYCRRQELYVDFSDVGWNDWIVAPPGYNAYYCHGNCDMFPLPEYINTTNHAIVQSLVHSKNPKAVPLPCCVPTELTPISMLYLDEYEKVVLKNYQDMVVEGCGCR